MSISCERIYQFKPWIAAAASIVVKRCKILNIHRSKRICLTKQSARTARQSPTQPSVGRKDCAGVFSECHVALSNGDGGRPAVSQHLCQR